MATPERIYFDEEIPVNVIGIGGTIPGDLGDINELKKIFEDLKDARTDLGTKTC